MSCYRCGGEGHWKATCPLPAVAGVPVADAARKAAPEWRGNPVPARRPASQVSPRYHEWANHARSLLGQSPTCGDRDDLYTSPARLSMGLPAVHLCQLRQLAQIQLSEARKS